MKKIILGIMGLVLIAGGCSCSKRNERGGTEVTQDKNAPTKVESTELVSLDCNASGEKIDCSDNQSNHLSLDTMKELVDLFSGFCN